MLEFSSPVSSFRAGLAALSLSDQKRIFDSLPDEILVISPDMTVLDVNHPYLQNNGLEYDKVVGRYCYEIDNKLRGECQIGGRGSTLHSPLPCRYQYSGFAGIPSATVRLRRRASGPSGAARTRAAAA